MIWFDIDWTCKTALHIGCVHSLHITLKGEKFKGKVGVWESKYLASVSHTFCHLCSLKSTHQRRGKTPSGSLLSHQWNQMCLPPTHCIAWLHRWHVPLPNTKYFLICSFLYLLHFLQVNLAIMQKQLSEMAIGHPRQSCSSSRQNGFSGGVGALGIMNNRLAETSVDR